MKLKPNYDTAYCMRDESIESCKVCRRNRERYEIFERNITCFFPEIVDKKCRMFLEYKEDKK